MHSLLAEISLLVAARSAGTTRQVLLAAELFVRERADIAEQLLK